MISALDMQNSNSVISVQYHVHVITSADTADIVRNRDISS